jgi:hypothetical protein
MTRPDTRHIRLIEAAALVRDMRLSRVSATRVALSASLAHRDALDPFPIGSDDPALQAADLRHRLWAEGRRRALAPVIAAQEALLQQQRREAARAVARCQVLDQLSRKMRNQPS